MTREWGEGGVILDGRVRKVECENTVSSTAYGCNSPGAGIKFSQRTAREPGQLGRSERVGALEVEASRAAQLRLAGCDERL